MKLESALVIFLSAITLSSAQITWPTCDPAVVQWFPHPESCTHYIICFHGVLHEMSCAPGLHFNRHELKCMLPQDADCDINYLCPDEDDDNNPVFLPDPDDCGLYYVCSRGTPLPRECAEGLWFDVVNRWCNFPEYVECDDRTVVNPDNPGNRTTVAPPVTGPPEISACHMNSDLFDGQTYLKSMCIVNQNANYETARAGCQSRNMNLFIIDNSIVQTEFQLTTTDLLRSHPGGFVWINGIRDLNNNQWNVFNADGSRRGAIYDGVIWVQTESIDGRNSGECLRYSSQHGPYEAMGVACNSNSWYICEHHLQTSEPTTTTPELTTTTTEEPIVPPNPTICWNATDLYHNDNYLKSMCIISTSANYDAAQAACRNNGMELFVINNFQVQAAFREASTVIFSTTYPRGFVWINGRLHGDCQRWHVFDPSPREMFNGVHFLQTDEFHGASMGECLRFSAQHTGEWLGVGTTCTASNWYVCEFDRASVAESI
ncbi:hypothetical protein PVAND_005418 [Polypedilum vanderplanki]|uniref:Chitin-binding type-2 domain-containing protein n=1 Tax=Polypedilum vanderplanki TaxID=319348 RepID=A0A9J6C0J1_POLVA|nr:hypothetical protein PVAND_005418 [Polypedilum vanderplanki]